MKITETSDLSKIPFRRLKQVAQIGAYAPTIKSRVQAELQITDRNGRILKEYLPFLNK